MQDEKLIFHLHRSQVETKKKTSQSIALLIHAIRSLSKEAA